MHKTIVPSPSRVPASVAARWLRVPEVAHVELTSEDPANPIENALDPDRPGRGWRAAETGPQTVHLRFVSPQDIREMQVRFDVSEGRTQEFVISWSGAGESGLRELVRQQFNFSPGGATVQEEHYVRHLPQVTDLVLSIIPDISGQPARASLTHWYIA